MNKKINKEGITLTVAGTVIMFLVGIIGYFSNRLIESTDALTESVNQLKIVVEKNQTETTGTFRVFDLRVSNLEKRMDCLEQKVERVTGLKFNNEKNISYESERNIKEVSSKVQKADTTSLATIR